MTPEDFKRLPNWLATLTVVALIAVVGVFRYGITVEVSYSVAPVLMVQPVTGRSWDRMVTVEIDDSPRVLRTTDRQVLTVPGKLTCLQSRSRLFKAGHRYSLAPPFYCRKALAARGQAAYL